MFLLLLSFCFVNAKILFKDNINTLDGWVNTKDNTKSYGDFILSAGNYFNPDNMNDEQGLQTSEDARFYAISKKIPETFSNEDREICYQFSVKHSQNIDCGGGYIKIFSSDLDPEQMNGESNYYMMFGPDICGHTKKVHVILNYKSKNHLIKHEIPCKHDTQTHLYTLCVKPDNTYKVLIDNNEARSGKLEEDWDLLPPKQINDPKVSKPKDWVDEAKIDDPEDKKPEDWDVPEHVADKDAKMPDDWDNEVDGEWEPPMVDNPDYKGEWKPRKIDNPDYKGPWVHPKIDNPEYVADDKLYKYDNIGYIGIDVWQVKSGSVFDNFLITDDPSEASTAAKSIIKRQVYEKKMEEEERAKEQENAPSPDEGDDEESEENDEEDSHEEL